ncbi:pyridoxal-phosphate dependent enzyme [Reichenbachiella carrageenanivorans]|uniref:Pyridoxal-phosphate dependent enzyme n=1 Tax=Reichenbachiella carrageenanivorans TaxID=2979869 RepID=A0ABY6D2F6_9BACT|nr:pyridoxal-phosphate dependent enzyme [Reichenbachiella carrageenanivorans]UXX80336.1 pyridoxal-phosphate dependent enzyme [Reichenbachiella carrageenanivorans]
MEVPSLSDIKRAHTRITKYIVRTPIMTSQTINDMIGGEVFFKCENFQKVGAFKMRGAANIIMSYRPEERVNGFVTHSSGNHAQAVALASQVAGAKAYIVMPDNAPQVKKDAVKEYGAEITFCEPTEEARVAACDKIMKETGAIQVHPFNDPRIIAGQATAAKEFIEEHPDLDFMISPVGGGGLAAGSALALSYVSPTTKMILAEPSAVDDTYQSFKSGKLTGVTQPESIADGLLVSVGSLNFEIIKEHVTDVLIVEEQEIIDAMRLIWERMKIIIEPSSAVAVAALLKNKERFAGKKTGLILTGGNVQLDSLPF